MPSTDALQFSWDEVEQIVRDAVGRRQERPTRRAPSARDRMFFELWRIAHVSQRKIAKRHNTSQPSVSRACQRVEKWLGSAANEELHELPAEEKFRAALRVHERKALYAERKLLRDYRRSSAPLVTKKIRVRKKPQDGELERWEETVEKPRLRDPKYLDRYVKLSREEVALAGRCLPMKLHRDRRFPREASAERARDKQQAFEILVEELKILHQEYQDRLINHQKIYGYMDKHGLKRDSSPSIPLGGWVPKDDFSARRDQPGAHTFDEAGNKITAESVYGPPEQWQVGTPEWFERKRGEAAGGQVAGYEGEGVSGRGGEGERGREEGDQLSPTPPLPHSSPLAAAAFPAAAAGESQSESSGTLESPGNGKNPRENAGDSGSGAARESESKSESPPPSAGQSQPDFWGMPPDDERERPPDEGKTVRLKWFGG